MACSERIFCYNLRLSQGSVKRFLTAREYWADAHTTRSLYSDPSTLQHALQIFCTWSNICITAWQQNVAYSKCNSISYGYLAIPAQNYLLGSTSLAAVDNIRDLMYIPRTLYLARIVTKAVCRLDVLHDVFCWKVNQVIVDLKM